jgi:hypothetical protein
VPVALLSLVSPLIGPAIPWNNALPFRRVIRRSGANEVRLPVVGSTDRRQMVARGSPTRSCFQLLPKEALVVGFGLVESPRAQRCTLPGAPEGVPFDRFVRCGAFWRFETSDASSRWIRRSIDRWCRRLYRTEVTRERVASGPPMVPFRQRSPRRAHAAKPAWLPRLERAGPKTGPRSALQTERFPSGFGSNGTRQHEAAWNDVLELALPKEVGISRRVRSSEDGRTSAPRG